jgi:nitroreductase
MSSPRNPDHKVDPLFTERWSPRAFTGETIDEPTLLRFFEAARWAPSGSNAQPWRFIYGRRGTAAWAPIFESLVPFNQEWAQRASALVVVLSRTRWVPPGKTDPQPIGTHAFDTGAAWASLAFQAHLAGWQTHGMAGFDQELARGNLGIPEDHALHAVIAIGRRGDTAGLPDALKAREHPSDRLPVGALVSEGRFAFAA